jgi:hypothetical protein
LIAAPAELVAASFDRSTFDFKHSLASNPLFELERLTELVREVSPRGLVTYAGGEGGPADGWDGLGRRGKRFASVFDALSNLHTAGAWVKIRFLHEVRPYDQLFESIIDELEGLLGAPLRRRITRRSATVFLSSPGAVTPYHIDHETNFFFQIRGRKTVRLFDGTNPEVNADSDLERFYALGNEQYRADVARLAEVHELGPGDGVHQPSCWPHWVGTGSEPSVSLSANFCLRERDLRARVYQCNYYLRRLGLPPAPPGRSAVRDRLKQLALASPPRRRPAASMDEHLRGSLRRVEIPLRVARWVSGRRTPVPQT